MSRPFKISQPTSEDAFCYGTTNEYLELQDMIMTWLEEYKQLKPFLKKMAGRVSESEKLEPSVNLLKKITEDRSSSNRSQI